MRKIFVILLLSLLWACNNKKNVSIVDSFKINQLLTHEVFDVQNGSEELRDPYSIAVSGNTITTWNPRSPDVFTTIDIATKRIIKHWGTVGQGPNEFFGTVDMYNNYSGSGLNIWNGFSGKLYFFPHSILESDSICFQTVPTGLNKPESHNIYDFAPSVIQIDTSIFFVAAGGRSNKRLALFNLKNNEVKEIGDFPLDDMNTHLSIGVRNMAYNSRIRYNNSLKKLVCMAFNSEMFEIYNVNGTSVKLAMGNYTTVPKYREETNSRGLRGAVVEKLENGRGRNFIMTVSDENIFILYQDYKKLGLVSVTDPKLRYADIVLVFDWNGKPVKIYELDCLVSDIDYDKATKRLWAIHNNPYPEIIYFEL